MKPRLALFLALLMILTIAVSAPAGAAPRPPSRPTIEPTEVPAIYPESPAWAAGGTPGPSASASTGKAGTGAPRYYVVQSGDTLSEIAAKFGVTASAIMHANNIVNADRIYPGQKLVIPGGSGGGASGSAGAGTGAGSGSVAGTTGAGATSAATTEDPDAEPTPKPRGSVTERMTYTARVSGADSPFYRTTWLTYYGRPDVPVMGILGEYDIPELLWRLRAQAEAYDIANGPNLSVTPAFHLIYGMATKAERDGSYLAYLSDDEVMEYVNAAHDAGIGLILDVQIGGLTPVESLKPALPYLKYDNVHLALDPEFAMSEDGQEIPGLPPGNITAEEINEAQLVMSNYMQQIGVRGRRILIVHQFLPWMIENKEDIYRYNGIDLTICADGFGGPWPKVSKYNQFMDETVQFTAFKLFYQWDEPLMSEVQAMGVEPYPQIDYIEVTPNMIIYQ